VRDETGASALGTPPPGPRAGSGWGESTTLAVHGLPGPGTSNMLSAVPRKRSRADYKRCKRDAAMQLWQMDAMGSVMITDPGRPAGVREVKLITGVDDHSRFV
jgi:hypothetical protein